MPILSRIFLSEPTYSERMLEALERVLHAVAPTWLSELEVGANEDSPRYRVQPKQLAHVVLTAAPQRLSLGSCIFFGTSQRVALYVQSSSKTVPPELNQVSLEVLARSVEGLPAHAWAESFFRAAITHLPVRYAYVTTRHEFRAKNLIDDENGLRAVGVLLARSLPGLYWLNYFGPEYEQVLPPQVLSAVGAVGEVLPSGFLVKLGASPLHWSRPDRADLEARVISALGPSLFYLRSDPSRTTIAPVFRRWAPENGAA